MQLSSPYESVIKSYKFEIAKAWAKLPRQNFVNFPTLQLILEVRYA